MSTIQLTPAEAKWVAHLVNINKEVIERHYVVIGPDAKKHWVCIFNEEYLSQKPHLKEYEIWSPLEDQGGWKYYGKPMPEWAVAVRPLLVEDGFSIEEIEQAEQIMGGL